MSAELKQKNNPLKWDFSFLFLIQMTVIRPMLQLLLRNIRLNKESGFYEAREAGVFYKVDQNTIASLTSFLKENPTALIADWYRSLTSEALKGVIKQ